MQDQATQVATQAQIPVQTQDQMIQAQPQEADDTSDMRRLVIFNGIGKFIA
jgi:hypothetical protein